MSFGIWMVWDEYKPCKPGTDVHDPSIGKWYAAGATWLTDSQCPVRFECLADAAVEARRAWEARSNAHPAFTYVGPRLYAPVTKGEYLACKGPDLRMFQRGEAP